MHNGGIAEFSRIKRRLQSYLPDPIFEMVTGNTGVCPPNVASMCVDHLSN